MLETSLYKNQKSDIEEAQRGNQEAMEKLIQVNNGLIWSLVKRYKDRGFEIEDLYQIAVMGFIKSIKKFDTSFEVKLSTYAVPYILGEIRRYTQTEGPVKISRSIKELVYKIAELQKEYGKQGKEIGIEEMAIELNTSKEDIVMALESKVPVNSIYEADNATEDDICLLDKLSTGVDEQNQVVNKIVLWDSIKELKEKEKQVILLRYFRGKTQTEVAKMMGVNQVQVSRMERKGLEIMKRKLTRDNAITA